jgi:cell division protein FtsI/penicillin-binding protein 2
VGTAYVAHELLGPEHYYPYLVRFGFNEGFNIDGPEEIGGYRIKGSSRDWSPSDLARQAFGQAIQAMPLRMAMVYQTIANGGVMMHPYLVATLSQNNTTRTMQPQVERRVISERTAHELVRMLMAVASYNNQIVVPGYSVAIKTGTATTQGLAEDQTEASMAGFIPASNPQFVILVKIDRPQLSIYGGTAASPLWKTIAQQLMWHYNVPPDLAQ